MKYQKMLYKVTFSKTKEIRELILIIMIVTAMISVFSCMSVSIARAYQIVGIGYNYDISILGLTKTEMQDVKKALEDKCSVRYSSQKTSSVQMTLPNENFYLQLIGSYGDTIVMNEGELTEGRMPENDYEILLDNRYAEQTRKTIQLGDKITLYPFETESISQQGIGFTVVGFCNLYHDGMSDLFFYTTIETMEKCFIKGSFTYGYALCSNANHFQELNQNYSTMYETATELLSVDNTQNINAARVIMNDEKWMLYQDEGTFSKIGLVFDILACLVGLLSLFMIYNAISVTTNEKIRLYGLLRSIGLSKKAMNSNIMKNTLLCSLEGILLGSVCGILLNRTVGAYLMKLFNRGIGANQYVTFRSIDSPQTYVRTGLIVLIVVIIAEVAIILKINRTTIIESIKFMGKIKIKSGYSSKSTCAKNAVKLNILRQIGTRNIKRNRVQSFFTFLTFFGSSWLIMVVITFLIGFNWKDANAIKKAAFCDYEFAVSDRLAVINSEILEQLRLDLKTKDVYGMFSESNRFISMPYQDFIQSEKMMALPLDEQFNEFVVEIFYAQDEVIQLIAEDNNVYGYDSNQPLVLMTAAADMDGEYSFFDREGNEYTVPITGEWKTNYLLDTYIASSHYMIMNETAVERYLESDILFNGFLVSTEDKEEEIVDKVRAIMDRYDVEVYFKSMHEGVEDIRNQEISLMAIILYLILCIVFVSVTNCINFMRVVVKQRRNEFGIMMALGMTKKEAVTLLTFEARKMCEWAVIGGGVVSLPICLYMRIISQGVLQPLSICISLCAIAVVIYLTIWFLTNLIGTKLITQNIKSNLEESNVSNQ